MASKVNTKFVVMLGASLLVALAAVTWVAVQSMRKSGDDYIKLGDKAYGEAKYPEAVSFYARAVFKDQHNSEWIRKWIGAMEKDTPKGRAAYQEAYVGQYLKALKALADADRKDYAASRRWLDEQWELLRAFPIRATSIENFMPTCDETLKLFQGDPTSAKKLARYRGLAKVMLAQFNPDYKPEDLEAGAKDLENAVEADPTDRESVIGLCAVSLFKADQAHKKDDKATVKRFSDDALARIAKFIQDNPPAATARIQELMLIVQAARLASDKGVSDAEVLQDRKSRIEEMVTASLAEKPELLDPGTIRAAALYARVVLPHPRGKEASAQIVDAAIKAKPDNARLYLMAAELDLREGDTDAALARLQHVAEMPDRPMSLQGLLLFNERDSAVRGQTDVAFRLWEQSKDLAKKDEAAALAKKFRDDFVTRKGEADNDVLAMDARLALINNDARGAATLLTRYTQQASFEREPAQYASSMALLGVLMMRQENLGAAKQAFERVLQVDPTNVRSMISLASIAESSQDFSEALRYTQMALRFQPDDDSLQKQEKLYRELASGDVKDEVVQCLLTSQKQLSGVDANLDKAIAILREGMKAKNGKNSGDSRLHIRLIQLLSRKDDKAALVEAIDGALAKFPDGSMNEQLKAMKESLTTTDPIKSAIDRVDAAPNVPELAKHIAKFQIYSQGKKTEEAAAEIAAIKKLAPEDPQAVEVLFEYALTQKDKQEISRLADLAEKLNLDKVNGQLYRARVLVTQEKYSEASQELHGVIDRDKNNFNAWRLLGIVEGALNNAEAAVAAFTKAVEIRPQDVTSINGLLRGLIASNRLPEALAHARKSERIAGSDPEFVESLIYVETNAPGGDKNRAITIRQSIMGNRPENIGNTGELALLQIKQRRWDDAKATIDKLRGDEKLKNDVAELDARWYAFQGKYADAERIYDEVIAGIPKDTLTDIPFLAAASLLNQVGQYDRAAAFLEKGRAYQKPETMYIDRQLGDLNFEAHKPAEAAAAYKRVLDAGSKDEGDAVAKRMLECYLILKDWPKFDELFAALGDRTKKDPTMLVLAAEAAFNQGDNARATQLYDKAVVADPKNFMVFVKRAEFSRLDKSKQRDAIADYEQAAKLQPTSTMPRQRLADFYNQLGRRDEAIEQLSKALDIDPGDDAMRIELINLMLPTGKDNEVAVLVDQAIKLKPDDVTWLLQGGRLMAQMGKNDRGADYLAKAWEKEKTLRVAIPYVTTLLIKDREADLIEAAKVATANELKTADPMPMHILKAMVIYKGKNPTTADDEVGQALALVKQDDAAQVELFMAGLDSVYKDGKVENAVLAKLEAKTPYKDWMMLNVLAMRMRDPATVAKAAADMDKMATGTNNPDLKFNGYKLLASYHHNGKRWNDAVAYYQKGLAMKPDDLDLLNNCAYVMAERLQQYSDALPLAKKAAELAPENPTVLDTLATVHIGLKNCVEAEKALSVAMSKATSDNDKIPIMVHMARTMMCVKKKDEAQRLRTQVRQLVDSKPEMQQQFGDDLKILDQEIDGQ